MLDKRNRLWVVTGSAVWEYWNSKFEKIDIPEDMSYNFIVDFSVGNEGNYWISTTTGMVKYNGKTFSQPPLLIGKYIHALTTDNQGRLWLSSPSEGLFMQKAGKLTHFTGKDGFEGNPGKAMLCDYEGNIWVSSNQGLTMIHEIEFEEFSTEADIDHPIEFIAGDKVANVYVLGNNTFKMRNGSLFTDVMELWTDFHFSSFLHTSNGEKYVGTYGNGYFKFADNQWQHFEGGDDSPTTEVYGFVEYEKVIYAKTGTGLFSLDPSKSDSVLMSILPRQLFATTLVDQTGNLWADMSYYSKGKLYPLQLDSSKMNDIPITAAVDKAGNVWHGYSFSGITRYDGYRFRKYGYIDGLQSDAVSAIAIDLENNVWLATDKGLDRLSVNDGGEITAIKNYGFNEGFSDVMFNPNSGFTDAKGNIWFGTINGSIKFDPEELAHEHTSPKIWIDNIFLNDEVPDWSGFTDSFSSEFHLPVNPVFHHQQNNLTFEFTGINFTNPQGLEYEYELTRNGETKTYRTKTNKVSISNLSPGTYIFKLSAINSDNIYNRQPIVFPFIILPPLWETWWFRLLTVLLIFGLIVLFIRIRNERFKKQKQVLEEMVDVRTKQLRAAQEKIIVQEKMASLGQLTAGIAHEIKNPLNFVNNFSILSTELVTELEEEVISDKLTLEKAEIEKLKQMLHDLKQNSIKISKHGHRADEIVKGMLKHSRVQTGKKEPADIGLLLEQAINLSVHEFAYNKDGFQPEIEKIIQLDHEIPVSSQDFVQAMSNLLNNSLYALHEKFLSLKKTTTSGNGKWKPVLKVSAKLAGQHLKISIHDNGTGISDLHKKEVMNPFFTTKPTGKGNSGLGLSLSYDIIVKQHDGEFTFNTTEGEYCEFVVSLPTI